MVITTITSAVVLSIYRTDITRMLRCPTRIPDEKTAAKLGRTEDKNRGLPVRTSRVNLEILSGGAFLQAHATYYMMHAMFTLLEE